MDEDSLVDVTRRLALRGARLVVFTTPMEPGPSPQSLSAKLPPGSDVARAALAVAEPGHDLAAALQDIKGIVPVILGAPGRWPDIKARITYRGTRDPLDQIPRWNPPPRPPSLLGTHAAGTAAANLIPDSDGVVRRMPLPAAPRRSRWCRALAAEALRVARDKTEITVAQQRTRADELFQRRRHRRAGEMMAYHHSHRRRWPDMASLFGEPAPARSQCVRFPGPEEHDCRGRRAGRDGEHASGPCQCRAGDGGSHRESGGRRCAGATRPGWWWR